jgi:predicted dehydrogenase
VVTLKFAIAGCQHSHIKMFIDEMLELGHEFTGIYDDSDYFLPAQYAKDYNVPLWGSLDNILEAGTDIVGNAARNDVKIDIIEWCEMHGIHVMTDKPIAIDFNGVNRLKNVIDRGRIKAGMMLTERFSPPLYTLRQMIAEGTLGDIVDLTFLKPHKLSKNTRPGWFFKKSVNGGLITDIMIHDVDILRWFTNGEVTGFNGMLVKNGYNEYPEFYDCARVSLIADGHITADLKADWFMPNAFDLWGDGRIFVTGTKGRAEVRSAGDVIGKAGPFLMLATNTSKAERCDILKVQTSLSEDFLNQINGKPYRLTAQDIYQCNSDVIKIDAASLKLVNTK